MLLGVGAGADADAVSDVGVVMVGSIGTESEWGPDTFARFNNRRRWWTKGAEDLVG